METKGSVSACKGFDWVTGFRNEMKCSRNGYYYFFLLSFPFGFTFSAKKEIGILELIQGYMICFYADIKNLLEDHFGT